MLTKEEVQGLFNVSEQLLGPPPRNYHFPLQTQEALLHEVCHAGCFGFRWNGVTTLDRITARFDELNANSSLLGLLHEAQCLAVERIVLRMLGWHRRIDMVKVERWAWEESRSDLPLKDFLLTIKRFAREERSKTIAQQATSVLLKIAQTETV